MISGFSSPYVAVRELTFTADADMKLKIKSQGHDRNLKLWVRVLRPDGTLMKAIKITKRRKKANFKFHAFGEYTLQIANASGAAVYNLKTKAKFGRSGRSTLGDDAGTGFSLEVSALAGSVLDLTAVATHRFEGTELGLQLRDAHGRLLQSASSAGGGTIEISAFEIPADGQYRLVVAGIAGKKSVKFSYTIELREEPAAELTFAERGARRGAGEQVAASGDAVRYLVEKSLCDRFLERAWRSGWSASRPGGRAGGGGVSSPGWEAVISEQQWLGAGRVDEGWLGGKVERCEDLLDDLVLGDGRNDRLFRAAAVAGQNVEGMRPAQQIGPGMPGGPRRGGTLAAAPSGFVRHHPRAGR